MMSSRGSALSATMVALVLALCISNSVSFSIGTPAIPSSLARFGASCASRPCAAHHLRRPAAFRGLRMADIEPTMNKKDEEDVPSTILSDDDLDARIAALGLSETVPVEDRSTGEDPKDKRSTIEKVQEDSVKLGETAIKAVASGAIAVLNKLESPMDEEQWKKMQEEKMLKAKEEQAKFEESDNLVSGGGLVVVLPVLLVAGLLGGWAIASDLALF